MPRLSRPRYALLIVATIACSRPSSAIDAELSGFRPLSPPVEESTQFLTEESEVRHRWLSHRLALASVGSGRRRLRLDIGPIFHGLSNFLRRNGVPVREHPEKDGHDTAGISVSLKSRNRLPGLDFHVGDGSLDPFDAFYGNDGLRWALVCPLSDFTLRFEGGEDSEFGSYGIAGAQWRHPEHPLSIGLGVPLRLRNADGEFGVILQLRAKVF